MGDIDDTHHKWRRYVSIPGHPVDDEKLAAGIPATVTYGLSEICICLTEADDIVIWLEPPIERAIHAKAFHLPSAEEDRITPAAMITLISVDACAERAEGCEHGSNDQPAMPSGPRV